MKKYLALSLVSAAFLSSVGCTKPATEGPKPGMSPAAVTSGAPTAPPAGGSPAAPPASGAPQASDMITLPPHSGLSLNVPSSWKSETKGEMTKIDHPDKKVTVFYGKMKAEEVAKFKTAPDKEMGGSGMTDIKVDKATEKTDLINGVSTFVLAGTGKMKDQPVEWALWIYEGPTKEYLTAVVIGDLKGNKDVVDSIHKSVKPNATPADVKAPGGEGDVKGSPEAKAEGDMKGSPEAKAEGDAKSEGEAKTEGDAKEGGDKDEKDDD